jgi:hypothetical protein
MNCHCGKPLIEMSRNVMSTLLGYFDLGGHHHDDNCQSRQAVCEDGHRTKLSVRRTCATEGCEWRGKEKCFCHPGVKLDAWPDIPATMSDW